MQLSIWEQLVLYLFGSTLGQIYVVYLKIRDLFVITVAKITGKLLVETDFSTGATEKVALVVTQGGKSLPKSILNVINLLADRKISILLVCNGKLSQNSKDIIGSKIWKLLERPNFGRDFGAYQAGILYLLDKKIISEKLIVLNDSMMYDVNRAGQIFDKMLESDAHLIAPTENFEPAYHIGSFLFCVNEEVQKSKIWNQYWRNYKPSSSRLHAIKFGEVGMSLALIKKGGFIPKILYSVSELGSKIRGWNVDELSQKIILFPKELYEEISKFDVWDNKSPSINFDISKLKYDELGNLLSAAQSNEQRAAWKVKISAEMNNILEKMEARSQIHWAGLIFIDQFNLGIIKKDFVYRGLYEMNHFIEALNKVGYPDVEEVAAEIRKRGTPASIYGVNKILFNLGHI